MEEKRLPVITISRQYAALGRTIAHGLQDRLGILFYDRDFVKKTAKESGYSEEDIRQEGESMSRGTKFWNSVLNNAAVYPSSHDGIYEAQKKVILDLVKNPCIIIGRCSNYILREAGIPSFDIYLYADLEARMHRAAELNENDGQDLRKYVQKRDELRTTYYKKYTGWDMGDASHYTISLNTGRIPTDTCLDILVEAIRSSM